MNLAKTLLPPRWMLPILAIAAADLAIRWRQATEWNRWELLFYGASVVFVLAWSRVAAGLLPDRQRHPWLHGAGVAVLGVFSGFVLLVHFDYFFYFGIHPEIIALGHVVGETAEAARIVLDELSPLHIAASVLLIVFGAFAWRIAAEPRPGRWGFWGALVLGLVMMPGFANNVAMSPGNFIPSVNLVFTTSKAIQYAAQGKGTFRRMQVSSRIPVPPQAGPLRYNVLILVNESLRAQETSYNGYARETTPQVDAFLKAYPEQTFNFSRCFTNSTKTSESVPSILTGVHPMEDYLKLHRFPLFYEYPKAFPGAFSFLYASHGYNVANFRFFLRTPRLDSILYQENSGHPRYNSLGMDDRLLVQPFEQVLASLPDDRPFVGILHMNGPHFPYRVPDEELKWGNATRLDEYDNSIRYQDKTIGAFLRVLRERGRLGNTIIFSTSDHGEAFGEHDVNGHRRTFYEEIIRVPCWMHLPAALAKRHGPTLRKNVKLNVTNLDWVPTLVDLLELSEIPAVSSLVAEMHGRSLVRPLDPERLILVQNGTNGQRLSDGFALVKGPWRLLDHPRGMEGHIELYNLAQDAAESNNLWGGLGRHGQAGWRETLAQFPILSRRATGMLAQDGQKPSRGKKK